MFEERSNIESFDHAYVSHYGDHESPLLERPLKAQGLATEEIVEHISCGPCCKEIYASMDWVDKCMTDIGMLSDTGSSDISGGMDAVALARYMMV